MNNKQIIERSHYIPQNFMAVMKVLIIDDDAFCLQMLDRGIKNLGYQSFVYRMWKSQTIQDIIEINPDLILLDEYLDGVRGSDICTILKSINQLRTTPVILVSGVEGAADIAKKSLADGFIEKPFLMAGLRDTLTNFRN
ncbi:MAG: response regulator transcription factor [Sphingobacteriaceae bacterium]|nr:response regulator transcription factor [Sphingobacteriaceae bacterium]